MASSFTWLDYSDRERRRVLEVVSALGEHDTRDQLGIATVRDAFSDLLAPGVSTIHTRVRYFLFIPWLYRNLETWLRRTSARVTKETVARAARTAELDLIAPLKAANDGEGVIGGSAGATLKMLPSSIYWNGLAAWRIRLCPWHIDGYHRRLAVSGPPPRGDVTPPGVGWPNWHPGLPEPPASFPVQADMALRAEEAGYLRDRILQKHASSLLGELVLGNGECLDSAHPWDALDLDIALSADVANSLRHAREFSLAMHGAVLLYNLMLAQTQSQPKSEWIDKYRSMLAQWAQAVRVNADDLACWDRPDFWRTVHRTRPDVPARSRRFVDTWLDRLREAARPFDLVEDRTIRNLIDNREREIKKSQARLHNSRLLEIWNGETGSGIARMSFRWSVMRSHLADIHAGLRQIPEAAVA